jgi:uncharacterized membrane protein
MDKIKQQWLALDPRVRAALQVIGVVALLAAVSPEFREGLLGS